jgi:hypothetical protein
MSDLERHERTYVVTRRFSPGWRAVAVLLGTIAVTGSGRYLIETDLCDVPAHPVLRLAGVVAAMVAVIGAYVFVWGLVVADRVLTVDRVARTVAIVEKRPFRRARSVVRSFSTVASVDVVPEHGDDEDSFLVLLVIRGEEAPLVVREFLERSEAEAVATRMRTFLRS